MRHRNSCKRLKQFWNYQRHRLEIAVNKMKQIRRRFKLIFAKVNFATTDTVLRSVNKIQQWNGSRPRLMHRLKTREQNSSIQNSRPMNKINERCIQIASNQNETQRKEFSTWIETESRAQQTKSRIFFVFYWKWDPKLSGKRYRSKTEWTACDDEKKKKKKWWKKKKWLRLNERTRWAANT